MLRVADHAPHAHAMRRLVLRVYLIRFEMKQQIVNKYLLESDTQLARTSFGRTDHSLSICEDDRHRVRLAAEQVWRHDKRKIHRGHLRHLLRALVEEDLQEADEEQDHATMDRRQPSDQLDACCRVLRGPNAVIIHLPRHEWSAELAKP
jgi:hypothetical protein